MGSGSPPLEWVKGRQWFSWPGSWVERRRRLTTPAGTADRISSVPAGDWFRSGVPISSRQTQRDCPRTRVVRVATPRRPHPWSGSASRVLEDGSHVTRTTLRPCRHHRRGPRHGDGVLRRARSRGRLPGQRCVLTLRRDRGPWRRLRAGNQRRSGSRRRSASWVARSLSGSPARPTDHRAGRRTRPR
jgi:hypothetical protein